MAYFLILQLLRTREHRNHLIEMTEKLGNALLTKTSEFSSGDFHVQVDREWVSIFQSGFMFDAEFMETAVHALFNHIWLFGINETDQPFYTSDNPVVKRAHYSELDFRQT